MANPTPDAAQAERDAAVRERDASLQHIRAVVAERDRSFAAMQEAEAERDAANNTLSRALDAFSRDIRRVEAERDAARAALARIAEYVEPMDGAASRVVLATARAALTPPTPVPPADPTPDAAREAVTRCGDVRANTPCTREAGHDGPHWHEKHGTRSRILWHDDTRDLRAKLAAAEARAARLEEALREIAEDYCMCEDEDGYSLGQCAVCKAEDALDAARAAGGADHG